MKIVILSKTDLNSLVTGIRNSFLDQNIKLKLGKFKEYIAHCLGVKTFNQCLHRLYDGEPIIIGLNEFEHAFRKGFSKTFKVEIPLRSWKKIVDNMVSGAQESLMFTPLKLDQRLGSQRPFFEEQLPAFELISKSPNPKSFANRFRTQQGIRVTPSKPENLTLCIYDNYIMSTDHALHGANLVGTLNLNPLLSNAEIGRVLSSYVFDIEQVIEQYKSMELESEAESDGMFYDDWLLQSKYKYANSLERIRDDIYQSSIYFNHLDVMKFEKYLSKLPENIKSYAAELFIKHSHELMRNKSN